MTARKTKSLFLSLVRLMVHSRRRWREKWACPVKLIGGRREKI